MYVDRKKTPPTPSLEDSLLLLEPVADGVPVPASERLECALAVLVDALAEVARRAGDRELSEGAAERIHAAALLLARACDEAAPPGSRHRPS